MDKINAVLNNQKFAEHLKKNELYERERKFCCHNLQHFLDVARLAYVMVLENNMDVSKEIVYGAALLHDIGKWMQYEEGIPHEISSYKLAKEILLEGGYETKEIEFILSAILNHRKENNPKGTFNHIFYLSDKLSRNCFSCDSIDKCKWPKEKKNYGIIY